MPSACLLALTTIIAAFQRMKARMRRSMCSSPGNHGSYSRGIVLTYGVLTVAGKLTWLALARSSSFDSRNRARVLPCVSTTASSESSHSWVSVGSMSGNWCTKPSKIMRSFSHGSARPRPSSPNRRFDVRRRRRHGQSGGQVGDCVCRAGAAARRR